MAGTMSRADLRADLKASLHDSAAVLADPEDFDRCLDVAAADIGSFGGSSASRTLAATLTLIAGESEYAAPDDLLRFKMALWGASTPAKPWDKSFPGRLPDVLHADGMLILLPAPSALQIALLGSAYRYFYFAAHELSDTAGNTTLAAGNRPLLILRAQAECCRELALRNITKPVALRDGISSAPRNGHPAVLYKQLLDEFEEKVSR